MLKTVHEEEMCCGHKRCPKVRLFEDGSAELTDDDSAIGSVGTIKLRPEVVKRFVELAAAHTK